MFTFIALLAMTTASFAQRGGLTYHEVQIVDELGRKVTTISSVTIRDPGTTDESTIYKDAARTLAIDQEITTTSTNTTLSNGSLYWYGPDGWDYTITDGTNIHSNYGHVALNSSNSMLTFPSYLQSLSTLTYTDAQSATFGTDSDFVLNGGGTADTLNLTSANKLEAAYFNIGADTYGIDLKVFGTTSGDYWEWDASADLFTIVGDAVAWTLTEAASTAVNIDITGAAGGFDLDTTNGAVAMTAGGSSNGDITLTAGDDFGVVVTGDIDIDSSAGDVTISANAAQKNVTIDSVLGSVLITATENLADAVLITSNGGTAGTIKIHADTGNPATAGAASVQVTSDIGAIQLLASANVAATEKASAIQFTAVAGAIELYSGLNATNAIKLTADSDTAADIVIFNDTGSSADSIYLLTDAGGITATATAGAITMSGIGGHSITSTAVADTAYGLEVASTIAGATRSEGAAIYAHTTVTGNLDGATYVTGTWMDIGAATPTANVLAAADFGIYESGGTLTSVGNTACINMGLYLDATNGPTNLSMFRFGANSNPATGTLPDYLFYADNKAAVAYSYDTGTSDTKQGAIKVYIKGGDVGVNTMYLRLYDGPG